MGWIRLVLSRLNGLLRRRSVDGDIDEEIAFHIRMQTAENVARGLDPDEARREAVRAFGNLGHIKDVALDVRGGGILETLVQDVVFGFRRMLKNPTFTAVAVLSLALGIGANTAIFSLVDAVLLRKPPVERPDQLVAVSPVQKDDSVTAFSYPNYLDFRDRNDVFSGLFVTRFAPVSLNAGGNTERAWSFMVSANYFDVLGVKPALGRAFAPEMDRAPLESPFVVVSYDFWQRRLSGDPSAVGRSITINGRDFTVLGVTPKEFTGHDVAFKPDLYVPVSMQKWIEPSNDWLTSRDTQNLFATGRLKEGVSVERAKASLDALAEQLGREYPETNEGQTIALTPPGLIHPMLRGPVVGFTGVLMATVGLVLLVACTNLANLLLARAVERRREIAVRLALGASRARIVRQLVTECVMLSVAGGALGLWLAELIVGAVAAFRPPLDFPLTIDLAIDANVFAFSLVVSVLTGVVFGLVPAVQATRPEIVPALKEGTSQSGGARGRMRSALVVGQVALSFVLLICAGLVVRTLHNLQTTSPGFDADRTVMISVDPSLQGYDAARGRELYRRLLDRTRSLPGVESATLTDYVPLSLDFNMSSVMIEGQPPLRGAELPNVMTSRVGADYFATFGVPLVAGREFTPTEISDGTKVVVVNEAFARRFFPGEDPVASALGKRLSTGDAAGPFYEIVGVARDGKYFSVAEDPRPFMYFPIVNGYAPSAALVVRTSGNPEALVGPLRAEVRDIDPTMPVYNAKTLSSHLGLSLFPARVAAALLGAFGLLALTLAGIGVYGVMSYAVAQRTREIGVRLALGARPGDVVRMVVRQGAVLAGVGVAIGVAGSVVVAGFLGGVLAGVGPTDPATYATISVVLAAVVLTAAGLPAWRASRVDPMTALRSE